jgi:hypothetical protein
MIHTGELFKHMGESLKHMGDFVNSSHKTSNFPGGLRGIVRTNYKVLVTSNVYRVPHVWFSFFDFVFQTN